MAKQTITIELDTPDGADGYTGIEGNGYHALEDFFVGLGYPKPKIDYGLDEYDEPHPPLHREVTFFSTLMERAKTHCKLRLAVDPKYMDGADETDLDGINELDSSCVTLRYSYWSGCNCHGSTEHGTVTIGLDDLFHKDWEQVKAELERKAAEQKAIDEAARKADEERRQKAELERKRADLARLKQELGEG